MKVLHTVELYYPSAGGMQEVVKQISERLVKLGHEVTVATTKLSERKNKIINGVKIEEFNIEGNLVRGLKGDTEKYKKFLIDSDFDIITNFAAQQWASDLAFDILDKIKAKKVFVPTGFSGLYLPEYKDYFEKMKDWMKKYDMNIFLSNDYRDINFARKNKINTIKFNDLGHCLLLNGEPIPTLESALKILSKYPIKDFLIPPNLFHWL